MKIIDRFKSLMALAVLLICSTAAQAMLINGDFETGNLNGWTTFTTVNGTLGNGGTVTSFDTTGSGASSAATFQVGQVNFQSGVPAGGGIFQSVVLAAGNYTLSADIAASASSGNSSGGIFDLLFDGVVVNSVDFGSIGTGITERGLLASVGVATAGSHEVRLLMQRPFIISSSTPLQYIDNVVLQVDANVPAPATLALFGLGLAGLGWSRRKQLA